MGARHPCPLVPLNPLLCPRRLSFRPKTPEISELERMIQKLRILGKVSRQSEMLYFGDEDRSNKYFVKPCAESNGTEILRTKCSKIVNTPKG